MAHAQSLYCCSHFSGTPTFKWTVTGRTLRSQCVKHYLGPQVLVDSGRRLPSFCYCDYTVGDADVQGSVRDGGRCQHELTQLVRANQFELLSSSDDECLSLFITHIDLAIGCDRR